MRLDSPVVHAVIKAQDFLATLEFETYQNSPPCENLAGDLVGAYLREITLFGIECSTRLYRPIGLQRFYKCQLFMKSVVVRSVKCLEAVKD